MTELIWDGKYDESGRRVSAPRIALPFQTVETINESAADRDRNFDVFASGRDTDWRNRLIWGDKKYVLPSLLEEFAGKVNLIYIDPPFDTGANFSFTATIPADPNGQAEDVDFEKMPSMLEQKAYRDTWGLGRDSYLKWFSSTVEILRELLADDGSIFVHLDWHVGHYAKAILDDVFGTDNFRNEIVWWYYNKMQGNVNHFPRNHDTIFYYVKSSKFKFERLSEPRPEPIRQQRRKWDSESGTLKQARDESGELEYYTVTDRLLDDVWRLHYLMPADRKENLGYRTQKPEALLERIVKAASKEGDLVLDCFCGSGTTAAVAEKMNRRWIACDLGRFAIHTTRKRLLGVANVKPFDVENLGKYERQAWQVAEFGEGGEAQIRAYRRFILNLYGAQSVDGFVWLHGSKRGRMIHVGSIDAPVTMADVTSIATEIRQAIGRGADAPKRSGVDILGWDFGFELNETARQQAALAGIDLRLVRIPREVLEKKAVDQGDIRFFELAALSVKTKKKGRTVTLELADFVIPLDDVPQDVQSQITHWEQWVDYWAVDWDNSGDAFHNEWQAYRTRKEPALDKKASHTYPTAGNYRVLVKVIDLLGNDTTKAIQIEVK